MDFRDLVRELARHFRTRIELRQIGVRDEARIVGGLGKVAGPLQDLAQRLFPVSIRMAKQQTRPQPHGDLGQCGRLLCCLGTRTTFTRT